MSQSVAILIPCKSEAKELGDSELFGTFLPSFADSLSDKYRYIIYVGVDHGDTLFTSIEESAKGLLSDCVRVKRIEYPAELKKGHLTRMWNILFDVALDDGNDYFYQCGDDIKLLHPNWVESCIDFLESTGGYGVVGPKNIVGEREILTQTFVSRRHKEIFGYYFPEQILNWYCDDWINEVYQNSGLLLQLGSHELVNTIVATGEVATRYQPYLGKDEYVGQIINGMRVLNGFLASSEFRPSSLLHLRVKVKAILRLIRKKFNVTELATENALD